MSAEDIAVIRRALARYRRISYLYRYGGMAKDYEHAMAALEALDHLEQPQLWEDDINDDADHRYTATV